MGKRSDFPRCKNDAYFTPYEAVIPLLEHLDDKTIFIEPCAGDYRLAAHLERNGHTCLFSCDIDPKHPNVDKIDAMQLQNTGGASRIITNPAWTREILHPMIWHFMNMAPTWLLFDASWKYTEQKHMAKRMGCKTVSELLRHCVKIVRVGRVEWIEGSGMKGKDDCAWYLFDINHTEYPRFTPEGWNMEEVA